MHFVLFASYFIIHTLLGGAYAAAVAVKGE